LRIHVGYEFDDDLGFLPTNSKDFHILTSDSYSTTRNIMTEKQISHKEAPPENLAKIPISLLVGNGVTAVGHVP
jgi:hypothetical protein